MKPKYLASACASTYIKYLAQSLVHTAVRGRKRGKRGQKRGRGMRSDASLGGGGTASPQAAITQQVISRCVCLACGAFSKKSVRIRPQSGPWQGGRRGEWADLPRVYPFLLVQVYRRLAPYTCRWYGLAPGGHGEARDNTLPPTLSHSEGRCSKGKGQCRGHPGHAGPAPQLGRSNCGQQQDEEAGVPSARRRCSE